jgi:hypothetical protein
MHFYLPHACYLQVFVVVLDLITLIIFSGENKLQSSQLRDIIVL